MLERARHVAPLQTNAIVDPPYECTVVWACQSPVGRLRPPYPPIGEACSLPLIESRQGVYVKMA